MGFRITVECLIVLTLVFSGSCYAESFPSHYKCGPREYEYVSDCEECKKLDCQETGTSANIGYCFWSVDDGACLPSVDTNCGSTLVRGGCSECGQGHDQCAGECFWLDETELCVHTKASHLPEIYTVKYMSRETDVKKLARKTKQEICGDDYDRGIIYKSDVYYVQPVPKARTKLSAVLQKYPQVMDNSNVNLINIHLDKM